MADLQAVQLITAVGFTRADAVHVRQGLLGYITCVFAGTLLLDGITLRLTAAGRPTLSFPVRRDGRGKQHPYFRPLNTDARKTIEAAIFRALGIDPEARGEI